MWRESQSFVSQGPSNSLTTICAMSLAPGTKIRNSSRIGSDSRSEWMSHKTAISLSRCKETSPGLWDKRCIYLQKSINTNGTLNSTPNRVYELCEIFTSWKKISGWDGRNQYSHLGYHLRHFNAVHKACLMGDFLMLVLEIHNIWRQNNFVAKNSTLLVL